MFPVSEQALYLGAALASVPSILVRPGWPVSQARTILVHPEPRGHMILPSGGVIVSSSAGGWWHTAGAVCTWLVLRVPRQYISIQTGLLGQAEMATVATWESESATTGTWEAES